MKRSVWSGGGPLLGMSLVLQTLLLAAPVTSQSPGESPGASSSQSALIERLTVNTVNVEAFVVDKKGRPVTDLTAADFVVLEDGKRVELTHFAIGPGAAGAATTDGAADPEAERASEPAHILIVVDDYAIEPQSRMQLLDELKKFVRTGLEPDDRVALVRYAGYLQMRQGFTTDRNRIQVAIADLENLDAAGIARQVDRDSQLKDVLRALRSIEAQANDPSRGEAAVRRMRSATAEVGAYAQWARMETMDTFQELSHLVNSLAAVPGRKAVIYVSEGLPMRPGEAMYFAIQDSAQRTAPAIGNMGSAAARDADLTRRSGALDAMEQGAGGRSRKQNAKLSTASGLNELVAMANSSRVSFYSIKALGAGGMLADTEGDLGALYTPQMTNVRESNLSETLRVMGETTGGGAAIGGDLQEFLRGARADFSSHYSLAYSPAHDGDGKFHEIDVKVRRRGTRVRHRSGYVDKPFMAKLADLTTAALMFDLEENPVGISLSTGPEEPGPEKGQWIVPIVVHIPLAEVALLPQAGSRAGDTQILVAVREPNGRAVPVQGMPLHIEVPAESVNAAGGAIYPAELRLLMREGAQRLAVGFVDPIAGTVSLASVDLMVGPQ